MQLNPPILPTPNKRLFNNISISGLSNQRVNGIRDATSMKCFHYQDMNAAINDKLACVLDKTDVLELKAIYPA
jgi:hypothetical protein